MMICQCGDVSLGYFNVDGFVKIDENNVYYPDYSKVAFKKSWLLNENVI